jgi:hypothetical protein
MKFPLDDVHAQLGPGGAGFGGRPGHSPAWR